MMMTIGACPHLVDYFGICIACGCPRVNLYSDRQSVAVSHHSRGLRVAVESARPEAEKAKAALLAQKKLIMLLDLDLTIIHATLGEHAEQQILPAMASSPILGREIHHFKAGEEFYLKVRPFATEFLARASELFEIHVYTAGLREYADQITKILDPNHQYFQGRVLTRTESPNHEHKFITRLFPFSAEMVVVIDDSTHAWSKDIGVHHLYRIPHFHFFKVEKHKLVGPPKERSETEGQIVNGNPSYYWIQTRAWKDEALRFCVDALERIHARFFSLQPPESINHVMAAVRMAILHNVHILFSGVIPRDEDPTKNAAWRIAKAFGATCETEQNERVTHVIGTSKDTEKCHWAKKKGLHVLHIDWLVQCVRHWSRLKEDSFAIHKIPACDKSSMGRIMNELKDGLVCYPPNDPVVQPSQDHSSSAITQEELTSMFDDDSESSEESDEESENSSQEESEESTHTPPGSPPRDFSEDSDIPPSKKQRLE